MDIMDGVYSRRAAMAYFVADEWTVRVIMFLVMAAPISVWAVKHKPVKKPE